MKGKISLQVNARGSLHPGLTSIKAWIREALKQEDRDGDIVVGILDLEEMAELNQTWRGKAGPTNVLSFPAELPPGVPLNMLGDILICAPLVAREAADQGKSEEAHWAHLLVHGTLHLLGYDHERDEDAEQMEAREIAILAKLGFDNPYNQLAASPESS